MLGTPEQSGVFLFYSELLLSDKARDDILCPWETREPGGIPSFIGGLNPPDERKEGVANGYIF